MVSVGVVADRSCLVVKGKTGRFAAIYQVVCYCFSYCIRLPRSAYNNMDGDRGVDPAHSSSAGTTTELVGLVRVCNPHKNVT